MDCYSLKMRASQKSPGDGTRAGHHISGAERIVEPDAVECATAQMIRRALNHPKGIPDEIHVKIERLAAEKIPVLKALPVSRIDVESGELGLSKAFGLLKPYWSAANGTPVKIRELLGRTFSMRGAMLYDIRTGKRLEPDPERGIRATYMDALQTNEIFSGNGSGKNHFREAIVLATKVANAPGIAAEICVSDDPDYVTGYVASRDFGYVRIMKMKSPGDPNGGRVFLFDSAKARVEDCIEFLERQPVFVDCRGLEGDG